MPSIIQRYWSRVALGAAGLLLAACGARGIQTMVANPTPDLLVRPGGVCQVPVCETVDITLADFSIVPARIEVRSSRVRFVLTNEGSFTHALEVRANGGDNRSLNIGPGQTGYLEVDLPPGEYRLLCPIAGHALRGQRATIEVRLP